MLGLGQWVAGVWVAGGWVAGGRCAVVVLQIGGDEELAGGELAVRLGLNGEKERRIGVALHVIEEKLLLAPHMEFLKDDVTHGEGEGAVGARVDA